MVALRRIAPGIMIMSILISACADKGDIVTPTEHGQNVVDGILTPWNGETGWSVRVFPGGIGSSAVDTHGHFRVVLSQPPDSILERSTNSSWSFSDPNVRLLSMIYWGIYPPNSPFPDRGASLSNKNWNHDPIPHAGDFVVHYQYYDREVNIAGSDTSFNSDSTYRVIHMRNFHLVKGWNRVVQVVIQTTDSSEVWEDRSTERSQARWFWL